MLRPMRAWLVIGLILAGLLVAGGVLAVGEPERTQVPTIELRAETTERTTAEPREAKERGGNTGSDDGNGATPAPPPAPAPAGEDDDDDDDEESSDDGDD